ncbi:MAG TPA: hypothetical protein VGM54_00710 [Chthoniobacter sp.]|jgi:hypothetical protein
MPRLISPSLAALSGAVLALALTGCKKPQIRVYTVAREKPAAPITPPPSESPLARASAADIPHSQAHLDYKLPSGWKDEGSSQFSLQNFKIATADGVAMVNITPLAGMAGNDAAIVNLWRQQLGEPVLEAPAAVASLTPVDIGGEPGKLFELSGKRDGKTERIITAFVHRPDGSWFYKLQGDDAVVTSQKTAFLDFLKTVKITPGNPTDSVAEQKAPAEDAEPAVHMVAPQGWEAQTPGQMQVAKFIVDKDGGKADVSVSVFPSDTGGTLANVNRWRRMLGLKDVDEAGLQECTSKFGDATIDGAPGAVLADLSNDSRRLLGAIVPREGRWWFYKMVGDAPVVNAEHDTFVQFVKSQP